MILAMMSWGVAWTNAKIVNQYMSYTNLVFLRYISSFIFLLPLILLRKKRIKAPDTPTLINIISVSFLYYLYNIFFFYGTDIGDAGFGGVFVTTTNPIVTFLLIAAIAWKINRYQLLGILIGFVGGCIILNIFQDGLTAFTVKENLSFIACSLTWGVITVVMSHGQKDYDSMSYIVLCYFITALIASVFINPSELLSIQNYDSWFFLNFFFVSIGAMAFGTSIYMYSAPRLGPVQTSVFIFSVPFIAMSTAHYVLGEQITINIVAGGFLSLVAIYLVNREHLHK